MNRRPRKTRSARHRGTALVLVLGVTSIVGVIGLSSLLAVRLQHRDVQSRADAVTAQRLADGLLQVIHTRLSNDDNWRSNHTHNVWSDDEAITDGGAFRFTLRDEGDGDLADDNSDPARLVVRVALGRAVRLASIELGGGAPLGPELMVNRDMENGTNGYSISIVFGSVNAHTDSPRSGSTYLQLEGRSAQVVALRQDLPDGSIESGNTYRVSGWMRLEDSVVDVKLGLLNSRFMALDVAEDQAPGSLDWAFYEFDLTPEFDFDPTTTYVYGVTDTGQQDLHFDDMSVRQVLSTALPVVRGSYRRELDN